MLYYHLKKLRTNLMYNWINSINVLDFMFVCARHLFCLTFCVTRYKVLTYSFKSYNLIGMQDIEKG